MMTNSKSPSVVSDEITRLREDAECVSLNERVMQAINHQETDRVPIDLWATNEVKQDRETYFGHDYNSLLNILGVDFRVMHGPSYVGLELEKHLDGTVSDLWGVRRCTVTYGQGDRKGTYKELAYSPLEHMKSVKEIRFEVKERMQAGKLVGGFIICSAHNVQRDVPIENILTLIKAYHELGSYAQ